MKSKLSWSWIIKKRLLKMDHHLFEEGNIICSLAMKQFKAIEELEEIIKGKPEFPCGIGTCAKKFTSIADYESHYNSVHKNVCSVCKRVYPTSHLLDIHLLEWHDSMFELLAQKQPMFQCLIPSCEVKLSNRKQRKDHMIKIHKYPSNFRFDREKKPANKSKTQKSVKEPSPSSTESMEVAEQSTTCLTDKPKVQYSYRVPQNFSFGHGVSRGFQRSRGKGRGERGKHWHNQHPDKNMQVDIENIDMNELTDALNIS